MDAEPAIDEILTVNEDYTFAIGHLLRQSRS